MGIYPDVRKGLLISWADGHQTWRETRTQPGLVEQRDITATPWVVKERTDCYCCSCADSQGGDAACRNHGWAAKRPCETHNMPGETWENDSNVMPHSVQMERRRHTDRDTHR